MGSNFCIGVEEERHQKNSFGSILDVHNRGAVRAGATGAIAPVDFQKWLIVPVNFEKAQVKHKEITQKMCI